MVPLKICLFSCRNCYHWWHRNCALKFIVYCWTVLQNICVFLLDQIDFSFGVLHVLNFYFPLCLYCINKKKCFSGLIQSWNTVNNIRISFQWKYMIKRFDLAVLVFGESMISRFELGESIINRFELALMVLVFSTGLGHFLWAIRNNAAFTQ